MKIYCHDNKDVFNNPNLPYASLLSAIKVDEFYDSAINFLCGECLGVRELLCIIHKMKIDIPINRGDYFIVIPLLRIVLEGYFRVLYVFPPPLTDKTIINSRFEELIANFRHEYIDLRKALRKFQDDDLPELIGGTKKKKLTDIRSSIVSEGILSEKEDNFVYALYKFCCFYSHDNMNEAITNAAECKVFIDFKIANMIEAISKSYIMLVVQLTDNELLQEAIGKIEKERI